VARILPTFDVFVLSSVSEGLPLALLEAMATGLPVVVTQVGGMGEAVRAGDSGLVVAPGDPDRLTAAVKTLIDDPALRARLGRAAQQRAREHFDLRAMVTAYEDVYQAVAR
jgi:glycosyltransferase involved in cell wall biosynthesis